MKANLHDQVKYFWIRKVNSRRGPAELSYIRQQELIQEVLEINQFLVSCFAQPLPETLIEWKFKSMTYPPIYGRTWVSARDACMSKK